MFQSGDVVILVSGRIGTFVRYYGKRVQIRTEDGLKVTGDPQEAVLTVPVQVVTATNLQEALADLDAPDDLDALDDPAPPKTQIRLGPVQERMLAAIKETPEVSYRELAKTCGITIPQASITVRALIRRGLISKNQNGTGKNCYDVHQS